MTKKDHVVPHLNGPDKRNVVVPLMMPFTSCDADANASQETNADVNGII